VRSSKQQSNTSLIFGDRLILKLFRRLQPGPNPDSEVGRYLTEKVNFDGVPPFAGTIEYECPGVEGSTLAMMQGLVANEGDAWTLTLDELERYYENSVGIPFPEGIEAGAADDLIALATQAPSQQAHEHVGIALDSAARLGKRTAALHLALAAPSEDPAFLPEPLTADDVRNLRADLREQAAKVFDLLRDNVARLPDEMLDLAGLVLGRRKQILDSFREIAGRNLQAQRTRIHGDYHLGQVIRVRTDYVILDFEGEPIRPMQERRAKHSPLKDVAGMLRSLSYAAYAGLINYTTRRPEDFEKLQPWARLWERSTAAEFLRAYRETAAGAAFLPPDESDLRGLLTLYWLDKVCYELAYELNNRPDWARIPLMGILSNAIQPRRP
jgi:maltose alpha-D-glucosyltransferase/alpha-amylase